MMNNQADGLENGKSVRAASENEAQIIWGHPEEDTVSVLDALLILVKNRRLIGLATLAFAMFGFVVAVIPGTPEYVATATVIRESLAPDQQDGLSALRPFGFGVGNAVTGVNAQVYPEIFTSREVRLAVVRDTFYIGSLGKSLQLVDYINRPSSWWSRMLDRLERYTLGLPETVKRMFEAEEDAVSSVPAPTASQVMATDETRPSRAEQYAIRGVAGMIRTAVDKDNGLMRISSSAEDPQLSADLIERFIYHLQERVRSFYTAKAKQNVEYASARLADAERQLEEAEAALAQFIDRNTNAQSARLLMERQRLERHVNFKAQLYATLQSQLTQAQNELQRSDPVITVMEWPVPPLHPSGSNPGLLVLVCTVLGLFFGIAIASIRTFLANSTADREKREKVEELRREVSGGALSARFRAMTRKIHDRSRRKSSI